MNKAKRGSVKDPKREAKRAANKKERKLIKLRAKFKKFKG